MRLAINAECIALTVKRWLANSERESTENALDDVVAGLLGYHTDMDLDISFEKRRYVCLQIEV
jgi:hypothetical protein